MRKSLELDGLFQFPSPARHVSGSIAPKAGALAKEVRRVVPEDIWADRWDARNVELGRMGAKFWCTVGAQ
jgi:hypothetical protein